ncbi:insulinase family protein [Candidatus Peregrinibacteria bacterium]|nr:insulinase family protein [Candidatus Peregrinibacteria bacterium]
MVKKTKLKNGLRMVTKVLPNTQSVTVLILVGAGSRYETKEINGISHFLEHMFFKGAKKYKNTKEVSEAIDSVGGDFNAFTGKEYAGYYVKVAADQLQVALDVLADMLIDSKFDPAEIDKERGVILEEYNMYQDTPMYQIGWDFEKLIFGDQPLGWDQVGTKELIAGVTQEQFLKYLHELYTPDNTVVAVAGNFDEAKLAAEIEKLFKFSEKRQKKSYDFAKFNEYHPERRAWLRNKKTEQAHVVLGFPGYADDSENHYAARLLAVILGGNMSSRMFLAVREAQGLAYYISTTTDEYRDAGTISTNAGVSVDRIDLAITSIIEQYKLAAEAGVTANELAKAKAYLKGKIVLRLEDSEEYSHLIGKYELLQDKVVGLEELMKHLDAVTLDQVNQVARELFKEDKLRLAVIGPYEDEKHFEELLKF